MSPIQDGSEKLHLIFARHQDPRDDIESFYFVLVWIMLSFKGPNDLISANDRSYALECLESTARSFERKASIIAAIEEENQIPKLSHYFSQNLSIQDLILDLGRLVRSSSLRREKNPIAPETTITTLYASYLAAVDLAIDQVVKCPPDVDPTLDQIASQYWVDRVKETTLEQGRPAPLWKGRLRPMLALPRAGKGNESSSKGKQRQISLSPIKEGESSLSNGEKEGDEADSGLVDTGTVEGGEAKRTRGKGEAPTKGRRRAPAPNAPSFKVNLNQDKPEQKESGGDKPSAPEVQDDEENPEREVQADKEGVAREGKGEENSSGQDVQADKEKFSQDVQSDEETFFQGVQEDEEGSFLEVESDEENDDQEVQTNEESAEHEGQYGEDDDDEDLQDSDDDDDEYLDSEPISLKRKRAIATKGNVSKKPKFGDESMTRQSIG